MVKAQDANPAANVKALLLDVFGTVVAAKNFNEFADKMGV